jgi:RNA polymerase sigma-70 factor (TIGR02960 family)
LALIGVEARMMTADDAFRELTEPYRHELKVHCYRMLGSIQDAEDALQDTFLTAWRSLDGFEARASIRTWLYRIATTRCLNALRTASRRPAVAWNIPGVDEPEPSRYGEVPWLEPLPDAQLAGATELALGPEARYEQSESISLAFITALQLLPPRQLAVLILRDVLGYHALEVAEMLDATIDSVNSALKRARTALERHLSSSERVPPPAPGSLDERQLVEKFVRAYRSADIDALVALLTDDVRISMPPMPNEYHGRIAAALLYARLIQQGRTYEFVETRANGQPALRSFLRDPNGRLHPAGVAVLTLSGNAISAVTRFDNTVLRLFPPRSQ